MLDLTSRCLSNMLSYANESPTPVNRRIRTLSLALALMLPTACDHGSPATDETTATSGTTNGTTSGNSTQGTNGGNVTSGTTQSATSTTQGTSGTSGGEGGASQVASSSQNTASATTGELTTCQGTLPTEALDGVQHTVTVNAASNWGELPHFWNTYGVGHMALFLEEDRGWGETLKAHVIDGVNNLGLTSIRAHGLFHDDIGIYTEVDGAPVYDFTRSDEIFDFLVEQGVEPIVELASMPQALARDPSQTVFLWEMGISPPKDFQLWQELVYQFTQHSVDRYGADVVGRWYFEVWNEPECCSGKFWGGTLEEYFELYDHAAEGVRRALPNGRVGGPVSSQPLELTSNSMAGVLFLDHVTTDNYVHPGTPGQLDWFAYHSWSFVSGAVNGYFDALNLVDSYGLGIGLAVTEFGPTWEFNLYDEPQETRQGAAFAAQTYADIAQRCAKDGKRFPITYAWWVVSDVFEEEAYREDDPFIGCMGLISRENIHKPAYNAYKFLAQMGQEQVELSVSGPGGVGGMAARSPDGGIQIILYNGQSPGNGPSDDTYYQVTDAHTIGISLSGLDAELPYDVNAYRVDEAHGNAYATWEGLGRPTMSAMTEENWQALRDTMDSPAEPVGQAMCGSSYSQNFSLSSPGVLFVNLKPAFR